ncbi:MAG: nucleotidyltransferase family protein [Kofleriaceae bacterium]
MPDLPDALVRRHLLAPLAYRLGIKRFKPDFVAAAVHAERRAVFLAEALDALGDIRAMRLKGIAYATDPALYDDPAERPMTDIDLMVADARFAEAVDRLKRLGYREDGKRNQRSSANHAVTLRRRESAIDLHRSMLQRGRTGLDLDVIWRGARAAPGHTLRPQPAHEYLIHLSHMARHEFAVPLVAFIDADRLLRNAPTLDDLAHRWRLRRAHALATKYLSVLRDGSWIPPALFPGTRELMAGLAPSRTRQVIRKFAVHDGPRDWWAMAAASARTRLGV